MANRFLISTSAGGEGINLQVGHILFNYDLPWNPMAIEQRIGRIHRYGQQDTVQVYNLVAEDTVEQRIHDLLEESSRDIARVIGKFDSASGTVTDDFRGDILGFLGSSPNYQELSEGSRRPGLPTDCPGSWKTCSNRRRRQQGSPRLMQDLTAFNLEHYRKLQGELTLADLKVFVEHAILRLGGAFIPDGDFYRIETPQPSGDTPMWRRSTIRLASGATLPCAQER